MSPRRSVADTRRTRTAILRRGLDLASVEGLEGLTIGRLATDLAMSKSGVLGHFGTKESLQLAVVDEAVALFVREVVRRADAAGAAPGLPRLLVRCEAWISYLERELLPGGCFFTTVTAEFDDRESGPVRSAVAAKNAVWQRELRRQAELAIAAGQLPGDPDAEQLVFELTGQVLALNHARQLYRDGAAAERARRAMRRVLGLPAGTGPLAELPHPAPGATAGHPEA
ncbi:TetR/AcrR family transcriptional regulator [Kitasatospora sp. A2-31]|uniref:TetR/AcrR family transcriptional regulator n=1 Tax=Kitasatospora sp. A2-31 TaxID=2916414 RepID=UPI001EEF6481|nr:TetR/AcrR family transcriptional regulator [Kitasatospora sp. A2-31]MCG6499138.1 TetR/AcrR family transcriptional regulator [Kitasatospora sp. A2-31]